MSPALRTSSFVRAALGAAALVTAGLTAGCPKAVDCGGLSTDPPDVADGKGTATRSDGAAFDGTASWGPGSNASVDVGVLDMVIAVDETGTDLDTLVGDGAFPICVPQASRSDKSGAANLLEGGSFITDDAHTGDVLLLGVDGDILTGRFAFDMVSGDGASTLSFTDGAFKATRR